MAKTLGKIKVPSVIRASSAANHSKAYPLKLAQVVNDWKGFVKGSKWRQKFTYGNFSMAIFGTMDPKEWMTKY